MNQDEIDAQYIDFLTGQLESSDDPEDLAKYVEAGGTLDEGLRSYIASLIRKYAPKSRGGRNQKRDCDVYLRVEFWRLMQRGLGLPAQATGDAARRNSPMRRRHLCCQRGACRNLPSMMGWNI